MATDQHGRTINCLRVSLTDACNLRCVCCLPEHMSFRPGSELLQDDELLTLISLFAELGFEKILFTGGDFADLARSDGFVEVPEGKGYVPRARYWSWR